MDATPEHLLTAPQLAAIFRQVDDYDDSILHPTGQALVSLPDCPLCHSRSTLIVESLKDVPDKLRLDFRDCGHRLVADRPTLTAVLRERRTWHQ